MALQVALRYPDLVRKLVFASSLIRRDGARTDFWDFMARADFASMPQVLKEPFLRVNRTRGRSGGLPTALTIRNVPDGVLAKDRAMSGTQGLALFDQRAFDLVTTDLMMGRRGSHKLAIDSTRAES